MADFNQLLSSLLSTPNLTSGSGGAGSSIFSTAPVGSTGRTSLGYDPNQPIGVFQSGASRSTPAQPLKGGDVGIGQLMSLLLNTQPPFDATVPPPGAPPMSGAAPVPAAAPTPAMNPQQVTRPYGINF